MFLKKLFGDEAERKATQDQRAVVIRDNYITAREKWPQLAEAELLALSIQNYLSVEYGEELKSQQSTPRIDELCLRNVAFYSVFSTQEALHALFLIVTQISRPLTPVETDEMMKLAFKGYELICDEEFFSKFLRKNRFVSCPGFWTDFVCVATFGFNYCLGAIVGLPAELYTKLPQCRAFRATNLLDAAEWRFQGHGREESSGLKYVRTDGLEIDLLGIDIILTADPGLLLVKSPGSTSCFVLMKVAQNRAVIVGLHSSAIEILGMLKRAGLVPLDTDAWDYGVKDMAKMGVWSALTHVEIPDNEWVCAICGQFNNPQTGKYLLYAKYEDSKKFGDAFLMECGHCGKNSIAILGYAQKLPTGSMSVHFDKTLTLGAGPDKQAVKAALSKSEIKGFLVSQNVLDTW